MANKYWVGGSGNFSDNTNHWADSSGGAAGADQPLGGDNVNFDANSHNDSYTVTMDAGQAVTDMTWGNPSSGSPTFTINTIPQIRGNLVLVAGMTVDGSSNIKMVGGNSSTVTTNGVTIGCSGGVVFNAAGSDWTLQDDLTITTSLALTNGTLDTNGQTVTCGVFYSNNANVRTLTLGASTVNCTSVNFTDTTNLTFNENTSTINCTGAFAGGGETFNVVNLNGTGTVTGSNTFGTLGSTSTNMTRTVTAGSTQTITTWGINGNEAGNVTFVSATPATSYEIAVGAGTVDCSFCDITDCEATGGAKFLGGENGGGNTGFYRFKSDARQFLTM